MPGEAVAAAGGGGQRQQDAGGGGGNMIFSMIRMAMFWYFITQYFGPKKSSDPAQLMKNAVSHHEELDMWVYLSEDEVFTDYNNESALIWQENSIVYGSYNLDGIRKLTYTYHPSESVKNNGSLYVHVFFAVTGFPIDPEDPNYKRSSTFSKTNSLVVYRPKPKDDLRKNLLGGKLSGEEAPAAPVIETKVVEPVADFGDDEQVPENTTIYISYWKPNCTINLVDDQTAYPKGGKLPPVLLDHMSFDYEAGNYYPTVYFNEFWLLKDKLIAINETVDSLKLEMEVAPISLWRWQIYLQFDEAFRMQQSYGMMDGETDEVKRVFLEGNPVLLCITIAVSLLHSVFDFLAFKNDIQFWRANKSMEGLSARTITMNFVCQLIIFFYLLDNDTSWMIIISAGVGVAIEFWKIGKAMHIEVDRTRFPYIHFRDRDSYTMNKTKEYDEIATRYLSYALYPLCIGYAIYSLMYSTHKSWYSWVLTSLTGCVYTFGFIMMCPQLFINYKLKSVAHLPWRQMTYKFLNTIIDDLFAFVIKMPTLHRLSVFRDDVIFLIYIYQRWVYPVDKKRINEFGFGGAEALGEEGPEGSTPALTAEAVPEAGEPSTTTEGEAGSEKGAEKITAGLTEQGVSRTAAGVKAAAKSDPEEITTAPGSTDKKSK